MPKGVGYGKAENPMRKGRKSKKGKGGRKFSSSTKNKQGGQRGGKK